MNIEDQLNAFKKIEQVDTPPFLLAKIKHQLSLKQERPVSQPVKWAFAFSILMILALNVGVCLNLHTATKTQTTSINNLASELNLNTQIDFYHEQN